MKGRVWIKKSSIHLVKVSGVEKNTNNVNTWRDNGQTFSELAKAQNMFQARAP